MYRIAICDDDIAYTEYLEKKIKEVLGKSERSSICKYYSGEEFIDDLELEFDLVFLDMQMGEIDGITAAIKFRKRNQDAVLVFCTGIQLPQGKDMELYTLNEVSKYYERWNIRTREKNINYVIKNLNLTIKDNEFIVVVGKSGIGKTTLLKMLGGIEKPSAGSIFYTNKELYQCKESEMEGYRRKEIGFIFQDYRLLDEMTVRENILVPQILDGARSTIAERKMKKLTKVLGISEKKDYYPYELSGGEKQRVAICRALINEPKVILADEPTGNLDTFNTELILEILLRIKIELKKTIILVTHDKGICKFADRIIEMKNGKLQEQNIK